MTERPNTERVVPSSMRPLSFFFSQIKLHCLQFVTVVIGRFQEDLLSLRAMGLTYTTLLSLVPLLAVTFSVLKAFGVQTQVEPFLAYLLEPLGDEAVEKITNNLIGFVNNLRVGVLGAVGVVALFYTVISLIAKIEESLNHIWRARQPRSLDRKFTDYLSIILVGPILVFTAFALTASAQSHWMVQRLLEIETVGILFLTASHIMPFVFLCCAFTFLYKLIPYTTVHLRSALVGGIVAGTLWQVASAGFAQFVAGSARYEAVYSSFAILIIFPIWLYVGWMIVLVGAEVAYFYQHPYAYHQEASRGGQGHLYRERLALSALVEITRRHLHDQPPWWPVELASRLGVPLSTLDELVDEFVERGILLRTAEPQGIALARLPEHITVIEVLEALRGPTQDGISYKKDVGPVDDVLDHRDQAVRQALAGTTLRSLASSSSQAPSQS